MDGMLNFEPYTIGEKINLTNIYDSVTFKNNSSFLSKDKNNYFNFYTEKEFYVSGDVNKLLSLTEELLIPDYSFYRLFENTLITSMPTICFNDFNASLSCCEEMFMNCKRLNILTKA